MKNLILTAAMLVTGQGALAETLTVQVPTTSGSGAVLVAVFDSATAFETFEMRAAGSNEASVGTTMVSIEGLTPGTYGVAVFHDVNGNGELDTSLLGAPKEPFGFSNNPKLRFSGPSFEAIAFRYDGSKHNIVVTLNEI